MNKLRVTKNVANVAVRLGGEFALLSESEERHQSLLAHALPSSGHACHDAHSVIYGLRHAPARSPCCGVACERARARHARDGTETRRSERDGDGAARVRLLVGWSVEVSPAQDGRAHR